MPVVADAEPGWSYELGTQSGSPPWVVRNHIIELFLLLPMVHTRSNMELEA